LYLIGILKDYQKFKMQKKIFENCYDDEKGLMSECKEVAFDYFTNELLGRPEEFFDFDTFLTNRFNRTKLVKLPNLIVQLKFYNKSIDFFNKYQDKILNKIKNYLNSNEEPQLVSVAEASGEDEIKSTGVLIKTNLIDVEVASTIESDMNEDDKQSTIEDLIKDMIIVEEKKQKRRMLRSLVDVVDDNDNTLIIEANVAQEQTQVAVEGEGDMEDDHKIIGSTASTILSSTSILFSLLLSFTLFLIN